MHGDTRLAPRAMQCAYFDPCSHSATQQVTNRSRWSQLVREQITPLEHVSTT